MGIWSKFDKNKSYEPLKMGLNSKISLILLHGINIYMRDARICAHTHTVCDIVKSTAFFSLRSIYYSES